MIYEIPGHQMPVQLSHIPSPPKQLFIRAKDASTFDKLMQRPRVAIVGSRKVSEYGQVVTEQLASELAAHGVVIVSGLAIGVDGVAHHAALSAGGAGIAVLPCPVERIHPASHYQLAERLIQEGGALVSEYRAGAMTFKPNFVARNRIVTGLADALLITEAADKSGTLHTANFAMAQGVDVLVVPGNITSPTSVGTNNLIKANATPVTNVSDIMFTLGLRTNVRKGSKLCRVRGSNPEEQQIVDLLEQGIFDGNVLLNASGFSPEKFNHHLTMLEITAKIRPLGANQWSLA